MSGDANLFMQQFKLKLKSSQNDFTPAVNALVEQSVETLSELSNEDFIFLKKVLDKLKTKKVNRQILKNALYKIEMVEKKFGLKKVAAATLSLAEDDWGELLLKAKDAGAEVVHLKAGRVPYFRIKGNLVPVKEYAPYSADSMKKLIYNMFSPVHYAELMEEKKTDFSLSMAGVSRFRVSAYFEAEGPALTFKQIPFELPSLEYCGLEPQQLDSCLGSGEGGLILVTGSAVSGKSTTCAAILEYVNRHYSKRIQTLESPIEFLFRDNQSAICQREFGSDFKDYKEALSQSVNEGADFLFLSEIQGKEELEWVITAAETGHYVLASWAAPSIIQALEQLASLGGEGKLRAIFLERLSSSLLMVTGQMLCTDSDGNILPVRELVSFDAQTRTQLQENKIQVIRNLMEESTSSGSRSIHGSFALYLEQGKVEYQKIKEQIPELEKFENRYKSLITRYL